MSILNVNQIQPVGGGNTITVSASDISASGATITATSFVGPLTGNVTGNVTSSSTSTFSSGINVTGGRVLIGTTNAGSNGTADDLVVANNSSASDQAGISIRGGTSGRSQIFFSDGTSGQDEYRGMLRYDHSENSMQFRTDAAERLRILSNGRVAIGDVTANSQLDVHGGDGISITSSGDTFLQSRTTGTTGTNYLEFKDSGGGSGAISYHHNGNSMRFKVAGSERLRIDSSGNAILKTANGAFKSENPNSSGDYVRMYAGAGTAQWDIYGNGELLRMSENSGSSASRIQFDLPTTHRSTSTTTGVAALTAQQEVNNGGYLIYDGKNSSGTSVFNVTHNGRVRVSDGIDFSSNSNASGMTSELLDDYEEGTFTPVWGNGTAAYSSPAPTYSTQYGHYTKIGNVVHFDIQLVTTAWNSAGSVMWIYGLPHTTRSSLYQQGGGSTFCIEGVDSQDAISNLTTQLAPNNTRIEFYYQTPATGANYNTFGTNNVSENNQVNIRVSGFYYTNS